jgi:hypothetical protein
VDWWIGGLVDWWIDGIEGIEGIEVIEGIEGFLQLPFGKFCCPLDRRSFPLLGGLSARVRPAWSPGERLRCRRTIDTLFVVCQLP